MIMSPKLFKIQYRSSTHCCLGISGRVHKYLGAKFGELPYQNRFVNPAVKRWSLRGLHLQERIAPQHAGPPYLEITVDGHSVERNFCETLHHLPAGPWNFAVISDEAMLYRGGRMI